MHRFFSPGQDALVAKLYDRGMSANQLADRFDTSQPVVLNSLKRSGVERRRSVAQPSLWSGTAAEEEQAVELYRSGATVRELAKRYGCRTQVMSELLARKGVQLKPGGRRHPRFNEHESAQIADDYRAGESLNGLAAKYDTNTMTIKSALRRQGVTLRRSGKAELWTPQTLAWALDEFSRGRSQVSIGHELGVSASNVSQRLRAAGAKTDNGRLSGPEHPGWKGGRVVGEGGYVQIRVTPDMAADLGLAIASYMPEHRYVMAKHIGRALREDESVHHVDGDRGNNDISNLQLRTRFHGKGHVRRCADCGSHNIEDVPL